MKKIVISLSIISIIVLCSVGYLINDFTIFFFPIIFFLIPVFVLKNEDLTTYHLGFLLTLTIGGLFCVESFFNNGFLYKTHSDSYDFYKETLRLSIKPLNTLLQTERMGFYYLVTGSLYRLLEFLGINSRSYFHMLSLNFAICAWIPLLVKNIGLTLNFDKKHIKKAVLIIIFFPLINYYGAIGIRDVWINLLFLLFVNEYYKLVKGNTKSIIFLILIICITYGIRTHNVLFFLIYIFVDQSFIFVNSKYKHKFITFSILAFLVSIILLKDYYYYYYYFYRDFLVIKNEKNSVGLLLINNSGLIGKTIYIFQYIIGPFPFRFFKEMSFNSLYLSLGSIFSYFVIPLYFYVAFKKNTSRIFKSYGIYFIIISSIIAIITTHLRHKIYLYPLILMFLVDLYYKSDKRTITKFLGLEGIIYFCLFLFYCYLKS